MKEKTTFETLEFLSAQKFRGWLEKNYAKSPGIWLRMYKKDSGMATVTYKDALDEALCFGWIDSQAKTLDEKSYIQKFTPRRSRSIWSKRNREHIERLIAEGKMTEAGLKEVEAAKADGRWDAAYDSPKNMKVPDEFLKLVATHKKAKEFFETLTKANIYAIAWRIQTAKKEDTKQRRMQAIFEMLKRGEKFH